MNKVIYSSFASLSFVLFTFVALMSVALFRVDPTWSKTDVIFWWIGMAISAISAVKILVQKTRISINALDITLICWYLYIFGYACLQTVYPVNNIILKTTMLLSLYLSLRVMFADRKLHGDWILAGIAFVALLEAFIGVKQLICGHSLHHLYSMTGTLFNPGPYATMIALGLVSLIALWKKHRCHPNFKALEINRPFVAAVLQNLFVVLFLILACTLVFTWSRAAIVATAITLILIYRKELHSYRWLLMAIISIVCTALYFLKQGSADGRGIIWRVSGHIIKENPWIGTGIGSFKHQYAQMMAQLSHGMPDGSMQSADVLEYSFNELLHIGVEQGLVGLAFALLTIFIMFNYARKAQSALGWCLPILLATSLFSYTLELLPFQIIMTMIMAYLSSEKKGTSERSIVKSMVFILAGVILCLSVKSQIRQRVEAHEDYGRFGGYMDAFFIKDYYEMLPMMLDNPKFLFNFGKNLRDKGRHNDSNDMLRRGSLVSNDPMFLVLQGNNYKDMGEHAMAEKMYKEAFATMPNRLYPLYRLMLLYEETGQKDKAVSMAERIAGFPVKIASPATDEMKAEAERVLSQIITH